MTYNVLSGTLSLYYYYYLGVS